MITQDSIKPRRPRPLATQDTEFFWQAARQHRLVIQRCADCGRLRHPPGPACPACHSLAWDSVESGRHGILLSYTIVHAPLVEPFDRPYAIGLIELDEGTRLVAQLEGEDASIWRIGLAVQVGFVDCEGEFSLPVIKRLEID